MIVDDYRNQFEGHLRPFIEKFAPPGYKDIMYDGGQIYMSWNVGEICQLQFRMATGVAEITWSSSSRTLNRATVALALYRAVVDFAAQLEVCCN